MVKLKSSARGTIRIYQLTTSEDLKVLMEDCGLKEYIVMPIEIS